MKFTDEEFSVWCQQHQVPPETERYLQRIRSSPPARRVRGRASNVSGRYPSIKMGVSIQFESHRVELWAIYAMERDDNVLAYYDQPTRIQLHYRSRSGHKTSPWHTPDFLVIRRDGIAFEEWKPIQFLEECAERMPERYQREPGGEWRCPPGEEAAAALGLTYRVRTSNEYHPSYIQNLKFLQDFWTHPFTLSQQAECQVLDAVKEHPGISVAALMTAHPNLVVDVVWAMLTVQSIFTDFNATSLMNWEHVSLYPTASDFLAAREIPPEIHPLQTIASPLLIDGRLWEAEMQKTLVYLRPEVGASFSLTVEQFNRLVALGHIQQMEMATPSPLSEAARDRFNRASPKSLEAANKRWREILAYFRGDVLSVTVRSVQNWMAAYRQAEADLGCGYLGLLDRTAHRGNRSPRVPDASKELLKEYLSTHYAVPQAKRAAAVYRMYCADAEAQGIPPVGVRTFYRERAAFEDSRVVAARRGKRAAYGLEPALAYLDQTTPRHGERPFERAHLDHTQLDIELVSARTGRPLGKPWVTFLTDAFSRRLLACYLTFDPPSYRSCMMTLRECVSRYGRLPQTIVVDGGSDFQSTYFETLVTYYGCEKKTRPGAKPRYGSVIERLFGTANTQFVYNLTGNTQIMKQVRQVTKSIAPREQAVWALGDLYAYLCIWAYDVYDEQIHPALGMSPREAFKKGLVFGGTREHLQGLYDDFRFVSLASTPKKTAKLTPGRGVKINYVYYNAKAFNAREVENKQVPVRYDPFDLGTAYAYVRGRWVQARSEHYLRLRGHSERELQIASAELRKQHQNHTRDAAITAKRLADFLADLSGHDSALRQHWQDAEARDVFAQMRELPGSSSDQEESVPVLALVQTEPQPESAESGATKPQRSRHRQPAVIIEDEVDMADLDEYGRF